MPPPPPPLLYLAMEAILAVLVATAAMSLAVVGAMWIVRFRRHPPPRARAFRSFADAAAAGALDLAEREAGRVLSSNDP